MASISLQKGSGKRSRVREKSVKSQGILIWIMSGNPVYGHDGHLGHVTSIMSSDFHFLVSESFHTKVGSDRQSSF